MIAVSTDPVIQRVLAEDFSASGRAATSSSKAPVTLTVTTSEQVLRPGISLQELAPGDPEVGRLLAKVGVDAPALGTADLDETSGSSEQPPPPPTTPYDPQQHEAMRVQQSFATMMGPYGMPMMGMPGMAPFGAGGVPGTLGGPGSSSSNPMAGLLGSFAKQNEQFDRVLVVKAELENGGRMTLVAVVPAGESISAVKQNLAERIAGALLQ